MSKDFQASLRTLSSLCGRTSLYFGTQEDSITAIASAQQDLRGPAAILFISRDTCSDSIAKLSHALVLWGIAHISRDTLQNVAKWGIAQMCLCEAKYQGGVSHHFGGVMPSLKKYRAIWGIAAIVSRYRAIWGH